MTQRGKQSIVNFIEAIGGIKKVPKKDRYLLVKALIRLVNEFEEKGLYDKTKRIFPFMCSFHNIEHTPLDFVDTNSNRIEFNNKQNSVKIK